MRLRFAGFSHTDSYASADVSRWVAGQEREIADEVGAALLADFPGAFVLVESAAPVVARAEAVDSVPAAHPTAPPPARKRRARGGG